MTGRVYSSERGAVGKKCAVGGGGGGARLFHWPCHLGDLHELGQPVVDNVIQLIFHVETVTLNTIDLSDRLREILLVDHTVESASGVTRCKRRNRHNLAISTASYSEVVLNAGLLGRLGGRSAGS